ncbi:ATP-binding cassette sub-family A member 3, partial [Biomphalaria glabrata]
ILNPICAMLGYQLNALLWKNFLLQLRSWKSLLVEICIPSFIFLLIVYIFTKKEIIIKSITAVTAMEIKQSVVCKILYKPHSPVIAELINDGSDRTTASVAVIVDANLAVIVDASVAVIVDANLAVIVDASVAVIVDANLAVIVDASVAVIVDANLAVIVDASVAVIVVASVAVIVDANLAVIVDASVAVIVDASVAVIVDASVAIIVDASVAVIVDANLAVIVDASVAVIVDASVAVIVDANVAVIVDANLAVIVDANLAVIQAASVAFFVPASVAVIVDANLAVIVAASVAVIVDANLAVIVAASVAVIVAASVAVIVDANLAVIVAAYLAVIVAASVAVIVAASVAVIQAASVAFFVPASVAVIVDANLAVIQVASVAVIVDASVAVIVAATPTFVPVKSFQNITEYEKLEKGSRFQPGCWRKVEFDLQGNEKAVPTNLRFKVVLNNQYVTDPIYVHVTISLGSEFESDSDYRDQEVSQVQYVVTKMFINYWQKKRKTNKFVATEAFYTSSLPERITISPRNQALSALDAFFPFLYIGLAVFAGSYVVEEKESRLKEAMKLMGLKTFSFWFSWFLTSFKTGFFICLLFMIFLKWTGYTNGNILSSSSGWILLFMIIYAIDAISFSFMLTCFINKARNFVICAVALYFSLTLGAPILSTYLCGKVSAHVGGLLFFQFAAQHFKTMFINFEWREVGVISEKLNVYEVLPYLHFIDTLIMFITNTLFNCIIIWYVSNIFPEEYGVPQPYNFFLKKSYWCPPTESEESIPALSGMDERYFQQASKNLTPGIQIRGLIKVFDKKVVVAGIDLDLFEDQITVLLGHNGAGKTTTINMLTGFLKPTKGTAIVNGIDLTKNLTKARENFGLCPQHDILFSRLTCNEHLSFYSQ